MAPDRSRVSLVTLQGDKELIASVYLQGKEYLDTVTLGPGLTITDQSIGAALISNGFQGFDGILG